ncbi:acyltransferase family protein [Ruminococcus sp.]|uniref:acyltransferase family protein n=1 Tax=Ruminococcus sp. TaxID=41978 RepID=UPI003890EFA6
MIKLAIQSGRIKWIDIAKAITILLVIVGHSLLGVVFWIIFSFHMFLFFFLNGWTNRFAKDKTDILKNIKKSARRLLLPTLIAFSIWTFIEAFPLIGRHAPLSEWADFVKERALCLLLSNGSSSVRPILFGIEVPGINMLWFMIALFFAKVIYDCLQLLLQHHRIGLLICTAALSVLGVVIGKNVYLFFSLDIALAIQIIFFLARYMKEFYHPEEHPIRKTIVSFSVWLIAFALPLIFIHDRPVNMSFAARQYPLFPVCYVCALAGTLFTCQIAYFISTIKNKEIINKICYLGKNSLYMLLIHFFDQYWSFLYQFSSNVVIRIVMRIATDLVIFIVFMSIRKLFLNLISKKKTTQSAERET